MVGRSSRSRRRGRRARSRPGRPQGRACSSSRRGSAFWMLSSEPPRPSAITRSTGYLPASSQLSVSQKPPGRGVVLRLDQVHALAPGSSSGPATSAGRPRTSRRPSRTRRRPAGRGWASLAALNVLGRGARRWPWPQRICAVGVGTEGFSANSATPSGEARSRGGSSTRMPMSGCDGSRPRRSALGVDAVELGGRSHMAATITCGFMRGELLQVDLVGCRPRRSKSSGDARPMPGLGVPVAGARGRRTPRR